MPCVMIDYRPCVSRAPEAIRPSRADRKEQRYKEKHCDAGPRSILAQRQLGMKDGRLNRIEAKISTNDPVKVSFLHPMVADESKLFCEPIVRQTAIPASPAEPRFFVGKKLKKAASPIVPACDRLSRKNTLRRSPELRLR